MNKFERVTLTAADVNGSHVIPNTIGKRIPGTYLKIHGGDWVSPLDYLVVCPNCGNEETYWDMVTFCEECKIRFNTTENMPYRIVSPTVNSAPRQSMDISSGFGIGGAGSDDYSMATEREQFAPQFSKHKSSGQLWEPCSRHGCDNEPVCLDCRYCLDKHCHCRE